MDDTYAPEFTSARLGSDLAAAVKLVQKINCAPRSANYRGAWHHDYQRSRNARPAYGPKHHGAAPDAIRGGCQHRIEFGLVRQVTAQTKHRSHVVPRKALRIEEAAATMGVSRDWFKDQVLPEIQTIRRGRMTLVPELELDEWLAAEKSGMEF